MKETFIQLWKKYKKFEIAALALFILGVGIFCIINSIPKEKAEDKKIKAVTEDIKKTEKVQQSDEIIEPGKGEKETYNQEDNGKLEEGDSKGVSDKEKDTPVNQKSQDKDSLNAKESSEPKEEKKPTAEPAKKESTQKNPTPKPTESLTPEPAVKVTPVPMAEEKYVPISEGWKASESAKGDITSEQKEKLDGMIEGWKDGTVTDLDLKEQVENYLNEQGISYVEVSVTSQGYALYDTIPSIELKDGGNLYSFVGIYCTGKQNPDGTNKTVCYNWSAFIF